MDRHVPWKTHISNAIATAESPSLQAVARPYSVISDRLIEAADRSINDISPSRPHLE
jgi:hypothetical protein